jgi:ribosome biogenesis GTPase
VIDLQELGWAPFFARPFDELNQPHLVPARVARQDKNRYLTLGAGGAGSAILPGTMLAGDERPAVGDWIAVEDQPGGAPAIVRSVLPRRSTFSRKAAGETTREQVIAANIDTVFLVNGLDGDFNLRRIERYATQAWNSGADPVILLNKADVCDDVEGRLVAVEAVAPGVSIHPISARDGLGLDALDPYLGPGRTVAFLGSSGVGKSTLVNHLLGREALQTGAVRADDSRGRHTTTHRELFQLPGGGLVIDTPGLRELQLWGDEEGLQGAFADIEALATRCRFRDCAHEQEPGCAVQAALDEGLLDPGRYGNYLKLRRELDYLARRQDESAAREERQRWKKIHKEYRNIAHHNPKRR